MFSRVAAAHATAHARTEHNTAQHSRRLNSNIDSLETLKQQQNLIHLSKKDFPLAKNSDVTNDKTFPCEEALHHAQCQSNQATLQAKTTQRFR